MSNMGGQQPAPTPADAAKGLSQVGKAAEDLGSSKKATPKKRDARLSLVHHSVLRTRKGTWFAVKAKSAYSDPVVVTNFLLFVITVGGLLNVDVFKSIFTGDPAHIAAAVVALIVSVATIALRIFYSKTPLTLRR